MYIRPRGYEYFQSKDKEAGSNLHSQKVKLQLYSKQD